MNAYQLQKILERIVSAPCRFIGVFPKDTLPRYMTRYPCCYVANTDISSGPGQHWVAVWYNSPSSCEFFDSYGMPPEAYGFSILCTNYNHKALQSNSSTVCGQFCLFFLYSRSRGLSLNQIQNSFSSSDSAWNDFQVARYAKHHFAIQNPLAYFNYNCNQSCVSRDRCTCIPRM